MPSSTVADPAVSTWTAVRKDGSTYHDLDSTFAELAADDQLDAVVLQRNGATVVMKMPEGAKPWFLRRSRTQVSPNGMLLPATATEFASCLGWERDGMYSLAWLMHDGSVVLTDKTDLDELTQR